MMRIGINATYTPAGGAKVQLIEMLKTFINDENIELYIYSKNKNKWLFDKYDRNDVIVKYSTISDISTPLRVIWEQFILPFYLKSHKIDVLFCPGNIAPVFTATKTVVWIGTIGPFFKEFYKGFNFPNQISLYFNKIAMKLSALFANAVIFESEFTKNLFVSKYNLNESKAYVIHIGYDVFFQNNINKRPELVGEKYKDCHSFALCVSHLYPYKNIVRMLRAFKESLHETNSKAKLLIAGHIKYKKYVHEIKLTINKLNLQNDVILLGPVSKEELKYLYSNCDFMIFPSPFENFAYTLVEAMSCGAPIACSSTTAMPETCQNAALYFNPYNVKEMSQQINQFLVDKKKCNLYKDLSLERVKRLPNYEEVTLQVLYIMKSLISNK
jgi:glycosyltransferase involved in cell wall biosynthesis